ncbi:MAG: hypothetical protein JXA33_25410 [Anaerolineae bacterium]|nr:hypothetical protein [Anaerolineae bacterium]
MDRRRRTNLASGVILILLGIVFLIFQVIPGLKHLLSLAFSWPVIIMIVGLGLFILGLLTGTPDMAIPSCIVSGIGGILYWQNLTGHWDSWSYVWALIPGFVGAGIILSGMIKGKLKEVAEGVQTVAISAVLFFIFGSLFGALRLPIYWPVLLILLGLGLLVRNLLPTRRSHYE